MADNTEAFDPQTQKVAWEKALKKSLHLPSLPYHIDASRVPSIDDFCTGRRLAQQNTLLRMAFSAFQENLFPEGTQVQLAYQDRKENSGHYLESPEGAERIVTVKDSSQMMGQIYTHNQFEPFTLFIRFPGDETLHACADVASLWDKLKPFAKEQVTNVEKQAPFQEQNWMLAEYELMNSVNNESLSMAAQLQLFHEISGFKSTGQNTYFWDWLTQEQGMESWLSHQQAGRNDRPDEAVLAEHLLVQLASFTGHRTHPMGKTKVKKLPAAAEDSVLNIAPYSTEEQIGHLPEFGSTFPLRLYALRRDHALLDSAASYGDGFDMHYFIQGNFPEPYANWRSELEAKDLSPDDYLPVPAHPMQMETIKHRFGHLQEGGKPVLVEPETANIPAYATMSVRTTISEQGKPIHLKLPINSQFTSVLRTMAPERVIAGPVITDMLDEISQFDQTRGFGVTGKAEKPDLRFVREPVGIRIKDGKDVSYQDSYHLNCLYKESPNDFVQEGEIRLQLASLFQQNPLNDKPLIVDIMQANGVTEADQAKQYFADYSQKFIGPHMGLLFNYGVSLESHQQNVCAVFDRKTGALEATLYGDLSGGIDIHEATFKHHLHRHAPESEKRWDGQLRSIYKSLSDIDGITMQTLHTLFTVNLLPMIDVLEKHYGLDRSELLGTLRDQVQDVLDQARTNDPHMPEEKRELIDSLEKTMLDSQSKWGNKSLFTMRIRQTQKAIATQGANPLYR